MSKNLYIQSMQIVFFIMKLYYENSHKVIYSSVVMRILLGRGKEKESKMIYANPAKKPSGFPIFREM